MDSLVPVLIIAALIALNGLFVAAEFAIIGAPRLNIERMAARGHRVAGMVRDLLHTPRLQDRYIATAQLGITFASLGLGMYGEHVLAHWIEGFLTDLGAARWVAAHALATVLSITILTYFHIVLGEMVPKSLALSHAEHAVLWVTPPLLWVRTALYPLVIGLNGLGNAILGLFGVQRQATGQEHTFTEEELQLVVQESEQRGFLRPGAGDLLKDLFDFGDRTAREVMTPRVRVVGVPLGMAEPDLRSLVQAASHTRYPVYEENLDRIIGVIHIKDILKRLIEGGRLEPQHARPASFLPEDASLDGVLAVMRRERNQLVVLMDEFGGTAGIVTIEDLFEEVVGEVEEEAPGAVPTRPGPIRQGPDGSLQVDGAVRLDELGDHLGHTLEHPEVDTVSGLVLLLLGEPPQPGDAVLYQGLRFQVTAVEGRGVRECAVTAPAPQQGPAAD